MSDTEPVTPRMVCPRCKGAGRGEMISGDGYPSSQECQRRDGGCGGTGSFPVALTARDALLYAVGVAWDRWYRVGLRGGPGHELLRREEAMHVAKATLRAFDEKEGTG